MKVFWKIIVFVLLLIFATAYAVGQMIPPAYRGAPISVTRQIYCYTLTASLVAVVWAIFFRSQLERRQFTLLALGSLVTMEAILFWAIRVLGSFE